MKTYDIIIIGAGPSGVMAAYQAAKNGLSVLIIEKGRELSKRRDLTSGWFGQALFKMNHLNLIDESLNNEGAIFEIFDFIKKVYPKKISFTKECSFPKNLGYYLALFFYKYLSDKIAVVFNTEALKIEENHGFIIHTTKNKYKCQDCLIATGKNSIEWLNYICSDFKLDYEKSSVKIGVRVEVPTFRADNIEKSLKAVIDDVRVDSFVGEWEDSNILSAFSYNLPDKKSSKTSFMIGTKADSKVLKDIQIINVLSNDKLKIERVADYMGGKSVLKHIKSFGVLEESFNIINKISPKFIDYSIMYIPEVVLNGSFPVSENMQTSIKGLYGIGECTSKVDTLIGAMASGKIAIETIKEKK